jgi:hypothetical protein
MTGQLPAARPYGVVFGTVAVGALAGVVYTLSPLFVWFAVAMFFLVRWAVRDVSGEERVWIVAIFVVAIAARVAAVAGLFVMTDAYTEPFGHFFGDEAYFVRRSMWLRNVALEIPIHRADLIYAFDEYSYTHYLYVLALIQVLVGFAPYGLHLVGIALYLGGVVLLYRALRPSYGSASATLGLLLLLFLPTLFAWSVSALKEPPYIFAGGVTLVATIGLVRADGWVRRVASGLVLIGCAAVLQAIRDGGLVIAIISAGGGWALAWVTARRGRLLAAVVLTPALIVVLLAVPAVQVRAFAVVQRAAAVHWGHINTPGFAFKSLDARVYEERANVASMSAGEVGRYLVRSAVHYVTVPLPWEVQSRAMLLALPEVLLWYVLVLLVPFGIVAGMRRDRLLTCVLLAFVFGGAVLVAVTGGNIGTLIRHRSLVMPFMAWLSALGAVWVLDWIQHRATAGRRQHLAVGQELNA